MRRTLPEAVYHSILYENDFLDGYQNELTAEIAVHSNKEKLEKIELNNWRKRVYQAYISSGQAQASDASHSLTVRKPYIQSIIRKHIPTDKTTKILDLGCGYGHSSTLLNNLDTQI